MRDFWNQRYQRPGYAYGTEPNFWVRQVAHAIPPGPVLCLAEGEGRNAVYLATLGYEVTAMDLSEVGLAKALALAKDRQVPLKTVVGDLADFDLGDQRWSGVVAVTMHLPGELRADLHSRITNALAPGGVYVAEAYSPRHRSMPGIGGPKEGREDFFYSLPHVRSELGGLNLEHCQDIDRVVDEGPYHQGLSAVAQILARKPKE